MRTSHPVASSSRDFVRASVRRRAGFTLVEVLTATALTLILMSLLAGVFAHVTDSVSNSRATIELNSQLTGVAYRLQKDLEGYTVRTDPNRVDTSDGYLEIIEGWLGTPYWSARTGAPNATTGRPYESATLNQSVINAFDDNPNSGYAPDTTLADRDDILMFTTRSRHEPFSGKFGNGSFTSEVAEVAWFVRGTTLYRRVLLVGQPMVPADPTTGNPNAIAGVAWWESTGAGGNFTRFARAGSGAPYQHNDGAYSNPWNAAQQNFYGYADLSVRFEGSAADRDAATTTGATVARIVPNSLADLALRQNRYAHPYRLFPYDARMWNLTSTSVPYTTPTGLGLPVLAETAAPTFPFPLASATAVPLTTYTPPATPAELTLPTGNNGNFDRIFTPYPMLGVDATKGGRLTTFELASDPNNFRRVNEDVILTNVIGFDVKVWDPGAPTFVSTTNNTIVMPGDMNYPVLIDYSSGATFPPAGYTLASYGAYVNLGYAPGYIPASTQPVPHFNGTGNPRSQLTGNALGSMPASWACVYDTWTNFYDNDGVDQDGVAGADQGTNGYDDNGTGGVDDPSEREAPPPYPFPLRGVQITLRVIEPDTQQVREVTVTQDFIFE